MSPGAARTMVESNINMTAAKVIVKKQYLPLIKASPQASYFSLSPVIYKNIVFFSQM
jgi:hypothetical protein